MAHLIIYQNLPNVELHSDAAVWKNAKVQKQTQMSISLHYMWNQ